MTDGMTRMFRTARAEAARLGRDESGVALMLTLSVFLLLYVLCAGVYAVGETVKQKIEMQNAVDAAAYSAAVVEADGLSRMAMINRAMAWTYIQLVNMQIDCITYRWLELVVRRFEEDKTMCINWNAQSTFKTGGVSVPMVVRRVPCNENRRLFEAGTGWFCGVAGKGMDMVWLNRMGKDDEPVPIEQIRAVLSDANVADAIAQYEEAIPAFKQSIASYNVLLGQVNENMTVAMKNVAFETLRRNLPRRAESGEIDADRIRDFSAFIDIQPAFNPYQAVETEDGASAATYFSPLYNTELDERLFLAMADGEAHDNLIDCFGPAADGSRLCGGLDQWFVRSYPDETLRSDERAFDFVLPNDRERPTNENSLKSPGICRVYKNANRVPQGGELSVYRANRRSVKGEDKPSCVNQRAFCPEQCREAPDSLGLYADYDWSSGKYTCTCCHLHRLKRLRWKHWFHVHDYKSEFIRRCRAPNHASDSLGSHSRTEYACCWGENKRLLLPRTNIEWLPDWVRMLGLAYSYGMCPGLPLDCWGNIFGTGGIGALLAPLTDAALEMPSPTNDRDWKLFEGLVRYSNKYDPKGFSRIYGDDRDLLANERTREAYTGVPAMPWILNASYYDGAGSVIIGLSRIQRNPWAVLLNTVEEVFSQDKRTEAGIYSAFDPVAGGRLVAFSAARAAHRFHPTASQRAYGAEEPYPREYETRYDAVCDDADPAYKRFPSGPEAGRRFTLDATDDLRHALRVGCVCGDAENTARLALCWNLCETDWDATLLPLRYARSGGADEDRPDWWDSYAVTLPGDRHMGAAYWSPPKKEDSPFVDAALRTWVRFVDAAGNVTGNSLDGGGAANEESGAFLLMRAPGRGEGGKADAAPGILQPADLLNHRIL